MPAGGYADTPGNGPTQSRLTLFARSLENFYYYYIILLILLYIRTLILLY